MMLGLLKPVPLSLDVVNHLALLWGVCRLVQGLQARVDGEKEGLDLASFLVPKKRKKENFGFRFFKKTEIVVSKLVMLFFLFALSSVLF